MVVSGNSDSCFRHRSSTLSSNPLLNYPPILIFNTDVYKNERLDVSLRSLSLPEHGCDEASCCSRLSSKKTPYAIGFATCPLKGVQEDLHLPHSLEGEDEPFLLHLPVR